MEPKVRGHNQGLCWEGGRDTNVHVRDTKTLQAGFENAGNKKLR